MKCLITSAKDDMFCRWVFVCLSVRITRENVDEFWRIFFGGVVCGISAAGYILAMIWSWITMRKREYFKEIFAIAG